MKKVRTSHLNLQITPTPLLSPQHVTAINNFDPTCRLQ